MSLQDFPFQYPASGLVFVFVVPDLPIWPMATQSPAFGQLTSKNSDISPLAGAGTFSAAQCLPFQDSAAAAPVFAVPTAPTATQLAADTHETPSVNPWC